MGRSEDGLDVFLTLGDMERLRLGSEVDRPAHTADFAADGTSAELARGVSLPTRVCMDEKRSRTW